MENYEIINQIGHGNFGKIYKIMRKSDKKILIWKELDYSEMTEKEKECIVTEVNILRELNHPNIVKYYERIIDAKNSKIYIIMEYCENGDISQLISKCKNSGEYLSEETIWKIFIQVLKAVHAIHNHKDGIILHRDIKPSNIFLDKNNNIKLGDFGLSRILSPENKFATSHVGTPYYMSPEQIEEKNYNEKSDIWSLGCLLYEMATFRPPFQAKNQIMLALRIKEGKIERINRRYSNELWKAICLMMNTNYEKRPSTRELMNISEIRFKIKEEEIIDNYRKIKLLEEKLKKKEIELNKWENELKLKELKINEKENNNFLKENELIEKEKSLLELEKKIKISNTTWYSNSRLKSSGNSETNFTVNMSPTLNSKYLFSQNSINNDLENLLVYTNKSNNNTNLIPQNEKNNNIKKSDEKIALYDSNTKLSKNNNIFTSCDNILNTYSNNNYSNRINLKLNSYSNNRQNLIQSKSVINCLSSKTSSDILNLDTNTLNINNTLSFNSPIYSSKNMKKYNISSEKNLKLNTYERNESKTMSPIDNNIVINSDKISNNLTNLINYSSLLSNMNAAKNKISLNKNGNNTINKERHKKNEEQKNNESNNNDINKNRKEKKIKNRISLIKNTKNNLSKLKKILKRSNTPRMNQFPTKINYKDNITYSNYVNNHIKNRNNNEMNKNQYYSIYIKNKENNKSFGNVITSIKRQNQIVKESPSIKSFIRLQKNENKKNITYRCNSSVNILKKTS